jgi:hypothetical protein
MIYFVNGTDKSFKNSIITTVSHILDYSLKEYKHISFSNEILLNNEKIIQFLIDEEKKNVNLLCTLDVSNDYVIDKLIDAGIEIKIIWITRNPISSFLLTKDFDANFFEIVLINQIERMNRYFKLGLVETIKYEDIISKNDIKIFDININSSTINELLMSKTSYELADCLDENPNCYFCSEDFLDKSMLEEKILILKNTLIPKLINPLQTYINNEKNAIIQLENYYAKKEFDLNCIKDDYKWLGYTDQFINSRKQQIIFNNNYDFFMDIIEKANNNFKEIEKDNKLSIPYNYDLSNIDWDYFRKI